MPAALSVLLLLAPLWLLACGGCCCWGRSGLRCLLRLALARRQWLVHHSAPATRLLHADIATRGTVLMRPTTTQPHGASMAPAATARRWQGPLSWVMVAAAAAAAGCLQITGRPKA
eukprot:COSAG01_NODE_7196_length_3308_cov_16.219071_3_plen_116_part_00